MVFISVLPLRAFAPSGARIVSVLPLRVFAPSGATQFMSSLPIRAFAPTGRRFRPDANVDLKLVLMIETR